MEMKPQPRDLHGDCRTTGSRTVKASEINCAARECDRIHAGMPRVIFVFIAQRRIDQVRRNFLQRRPSPEFLIGAECNAEQFPVAVAHTLRKWNAVQQRRFWQ